MKIKLEFNNEILTPEQVIILSADLNEIGYIYDSHSYTNRGTVLYFLKEEFRQCH